MDKKCVDHEAVYFCLQDVVIEIIVKLSAQLTKRSRVRQSKIGENYIAAL